jgi:hypothetical protein
MAVASIKAYRTLLARLPWHVAARRIAAFPATYRWVVGADGLEPPTLSV